MKIMILSDIHIEFNKFDIADCRNADVIVLAGDIHLGIKGIEWIRENLPAIPVIYILGNHEYYGNTYPDLISEIKKAAESTNVKILENAVFEHEDVIFHGCTLWTDFDLFGNPELSIKTSKYSGFRIRDFGSIYYRPEDGGIRPENMIEIHKKSLKWLKDSLNQNIGKKNIVVTHHAPSINSIDAYNRNDHLSTCFASDLEIFIEVLEPEVWIHGHVHHTCDYSIGKTRVICNPRGYEWESNFKDYSGFIIKI